MKKLALSNLNSLYNAINEKMKLYLPIEISGAVNFGEWSDGVNVNLNKMTIKSAKDAFFPQCEDLSNFKKDGKHIIVEQGDLVSENFVIFGVRACDVRAFHILDTVFLEGFLDTFYEARRKHGIVISLSCTKPEESCFCTNFGIDPAQPKGDVESYIVGDYIYFNPVTDKGVEFINMFGTLFADCDEKAVNDSKAKTKEIVSKLPLNNLPLNEFGGDKLDALFNRPEWQGLSESCIGCGTCTYVCPTCQCYDVRDYKTNSGIKRFRCWDSCMRKDFTMMAHGTNRPSHMQRFRQRFMHKLVYHPANHNGEYSWVGCGRCVAKCPVSMNIVKVMKTLGGNK